MIYSSVGHSSSRKATMKNRPQNRHHHRQNSSQAVRRDLLHGVSPTVPENSTEPRCSRSDSEV